MIGTVRGVPLEGEWTNEEVHAIHSALDQLPPAWVEENSLLRRFVRQPKLENAPEDAPGHSKYEPETGSIVLFDKGVYHGEKIDSEQFRRSIYHELAHTILRGNPTLLDEWEASTGGDGFVDAYARTGPEEDFADSFSEFFIQPDRTEQAVPLKAEFLARLFVTAQGEEKQAMAFIDGFLDELVKTGAPRIQGALLSRLGARLGRPMAIAGLAGGTAALAGHSSGRKKGLSEGSAGMEEGMGQAYQMGVQRGALLMRNAIVEQMHRGSAGAAAPSK
jgi:hypothetical protein